MNHSYKLSQLVLKVNQNNYILKKQKIDLE